MQCFTCNCCGCGWVLDTLLAIGLAAVWAVLAVYLRNADEELSNRPQPYAWDTQAVSDKRTVIVYLAFLEACLYALSGLIGLSALWPDSDDKYRN